MPFVWVNSGSWWWTGRPGVLQSMGLQRVGHDWATELNWTEQRTWKQPRYPLTDEWIKKSWYIYTTEYYSAIKRNTFESVLLSWVNLEPIIQSEVSQKGKGKYHILTHIYRIWKMILKNLFVRQQWRSRHREQTYGHGRRGIEGEMYGESNIETYIAICKIDSQWKFSVCLRELKEVLCVNLERWGGGMGREMGGKFKREGAYVYLWLIHVDVSQKTTKFCKAIILQLKLK